MAISNRVLMGVYKGTDNEQHLWSFWGNDDMAAGNYPSVRLRTFVKYYTDKRNFVLLSPPSDIDINAQTVYIKDPNNEEWGFTSVDNIIDGKTYYKEVDTELVGCPACGRNGYLTGSDSKKYTCPACLGKKDVVIAKSQVTGMSVFVADKDSNVFHDSIVKYRVTPPGAVASKMITKDEIVAFSNNGTSWSNVT